ncbi:M24 family metallopeptidase [Williamsia deligens]|uniref:M24 family metallopeptidase n=1 Tax=Williamsia deligens TaxID=321325 RepID=A0ABW3GCG0_9NOCA|nr:aminopeptidase P family protein [Williamsia deligens]MCP2195331.1 Xaa-Pro aminopeptidase [Williamsia deligens]
MIDPTTTHRARRDLLRTRLQQVGADAMLVSDLINVRYLSGFTGSNAALVVTPEPAGDLIATDGRYTTQVGEQSPDLEAVIDRACAAALLGRVGGSGTTVAVEEHALTVTAWRALAELAESDGGRLVASGRLVEDLRMIKDDDEIALLREACMIGDTALAALVDDGVLVPGRTEREVARALEFGMYAAGADDIAFETIVATGANSAIPHHRPTDAVLRAGDFVKIDFGSVVGGYHSDMTRTFVLEHAADWQREIYELVAAAQRTGREALHPGVDAAGVDAAARTVIADAGHGEHYVHGLGHGVGLQIHEAPSIGATATGTLPSGAAVTVEPGVYLPGRGGVRIEDTLVVREDGAELLTTTDRTFRIV